MKKTISAFALAAVVMAAAQSTGSSSGSMMMSQPPLVHKNAAGQAIDGYDAVSYFAGQPVKGKAEFSHEWQGATYLFANAKNRDQFAAAPEKYAPQFGGHCAWAVGNNYTAKADPMAWKIVDGKLYLNYNKDVQAKWTAQETQLIEKGHANWPALVAKGGSKK